MSNNNEQLTSCLVEESLSDTSINTPSIRSILKQQMTSVDKLNQQRRLSQLAKMITIITFIVVYTPIIAFNLYFAYSDNTSCVSYINPIIGLNLYDYLTVQAYTMTFTLGLIVLDEFVDPRIFTRFKTFYDNYILCYRVFSLAWISVVISLFISITYYRLCSKVIYYYVATVTILLAFSIMISVFKQYKDDDKLKNNST
jgi:hypothetical protein